MFSLYLSLKVSWTIYMLLNKSKIQWSIPQSLVFIPIKKWNVALLTTVLDMCAKRETLYMFVWWGIYIESLFTQTSYQSFQYGGYHRWKSLHTQQYLLSTEAKHVRMHDIPRHGRTEELWMIQDKTLKLNWTATKSFPQSTPGLGLRGRGSWIQGQVGPTHIYH